jgi:hypothetical protein
MDSWLNKLRNAFRARGCGRTARGAGRRVAPLMALAATLAAVLLCPGCASAPKVDWNARVGSFTFDQAVTELGPPDKAAGLSDGSAVAEWLTARGRSGPPMGFYPPYGRLHWINSAMYEPIGPDYYLRLTFGSDKKLKAWKRIVK